MYAEGASVTVMATANSGYAFTNWTECGTQVSANASYAFTMGTSDRTLVANFTAISSGGGGASAPSTPANTAPTLATAAASGITLNTATLHGSITSTGSASCTQVNFGYRLQGGSNWQYTTTQFASFGSGTQFTANLTGLTANTAYEFEARAYNGVGWGVGQALSFTTASATLPQVATGAASNLNPTTATLAGNITDTGGPGVACTVYRFQYCLAGGTDWLSVDTVQGSFGTGPFSFNLTGLQPGAKCEFQAQAYTAAGWGSSQTISFANTWGESDKETAVNMKAAGDSTADIATALMHTFGDTDAAALQALQYAGFEATDIAAGLKNSAYGDSLRGVVGLLTAPLPSRQPKVWDLAPAK